MSEFKGTKEKWQVDDNVIFADDYFQTHIAVVSTESYETVINEANALLISKAPCFYEDALKDLELYNKLLKSLPFEFQHLKNAIKERKNEKKELIKQATEL